MDRWIMIWRLGLDPSREGVRAHGDRRIWIQRCGAKGYAASNQARRSQIERPGPTPHARAAVLTRRRPISRRHGSGLTGVRQDRCSGGVLGVGTVPGREGGRRRTRLGNQCGGLGSDCVSPRRAAATGRRGGVPATRGCYTALHHAQKGEGRRVLLTEGPRQAETRRRGDSGGDWR
jgi:hypothetical protein